eukprot:6488902-Amphidinium_carterae.3
MPDCWANLFCFNDVFSASELQLSGEGRYRLGSVCLPMGWRNSVGLAQYCHRRMVYLSSLPLVGSTIRLPPSREIRRDKAVPPFLNDASAAWQIYIDDFDVFEVCARHCEFTASVSEESESSKVDGLHPWQALVREAYLRFGATRSVHKAGESVHSAVRLGAHIDGDKGTIGVPGPKLVRLFCVVRHFLSSRAVTKTQLQILAGYFCHAFQFRREVSSVFCVLWKRIARWGNRRVALPRKLKLELLVAICHLPLLTVHLRWPMDGRFTCSDASNTGGGVSVASRLSQSGFQALSSQISHFGGRGRDQVLLVNLFAGVGGFLRAFELLNVELVAAWSESDPDACKFLGKRWPHSYRLPDVRAIDASHLRALVSAHVHLKHVIVVGGLPFSLTPLQRVEVSVASAVLGVVALLREVCTQCQFHFLFEVLPEFPKTLKSQLCNDLSLESFTVDACPLIPIKRERAFLLSWHSEAGSTFPSWLHVPRWAGKLETGFFFASDLPLRPLLPPRRVHHVSSWDNHVRQCPDCQNLLSDAVVIARARRYNHAFPLCHFVSSNGVFAGDAWRLLSAAEQEVRYGFVWDHTAALLDRRERGTHEGDLTRMRFLSRSACPVFSAFLLGQLLLQIEVLPYFSWPLAWGVLTDTSLQASVRQLLRLDASVPLSPEHYSCASLLCMQQLSTHRGSDVRLTTGLLHKPDLWPRQSITAEHWVWRTCMAFRLRSDHINVLELRAILATLRWRTRRGICAARFVHASDSQICLSVLAKGRSSSNLLNHVLRQCNALMLAACLQPSWIYVSTEQNPADRPSRFFEQPYRVF